jgi:hypothetical protein
MSHCYQTGEIYACAGWHDLGTLLAIMGVVLVSVVVIGVVFGEADSSEE